MSAALVILGADLRAARNRLLRTRRARWLLLLAAAVWLVVLLGTVFGLGAGLGGLQPSIGRNAVEVALAGGFTWLAIFMLLVGFSTAVSAFYADRDLLLLASAPVTAGPVFAARLLRAAWASALVSSMLVAALAGYGVGAGMPVTFVPAALVMVASELLAITGLQVVVLAAVVRIFPPARVRDAANIVAALAGTGLWLVWAVLRSEGRGEGRGFLAGITALYGAGRAARNLPTGWPAAALVQWGTAPGLAWFGATLGLAAAVVMGAYVLFRATYPAGLTAFLESAPRRRRRATAGGEWGGLTTAMVRKDWLTTRRDGRRLVRILPGAVLALAYPILFLRSGGTTWTAVFVPWFLSQVFGLPAVAVEGRSLMLLRLASMPAWRLLVAKFVGVWVPVAGLTALSVAVTVATLGIQRETALLIPVSVWLATGFSVISVTSGAISPRLDVDDPRRAVGLASALTALTASLCFGLLSAAAAAATFVVLGGRLPGTAGADLADPGLRTTVALAAAGLWVLALAPAAACAFAGARALARRELG